MNVITYRQEKVEKEFDSTKEHIEKLRDQIANWKRASLELIETEASTALTDLEKQIEESSRDFTDTMKTYTNEMEKIKTNQIPDGQVLQDVSKLLDKCQPCVQQISQLNLVETTQLSLPLIMVTRSDPADIYWRSNAAQRVTIDQQRDQSPSNILACHH
jgi:chromosome segregation ATPase